MRGTIVGILVCAGLVALDLTGQLRGLRSVLEPAIGPMVTFSGNIHDAIVMPVQWVQFSRKGILRVGELEHQLGTVHVQEVELNAIKKENEELRRQLGSQFKLEGRTIPELISTELIGGTPFSLPIGTAQGVRDGAMVISSGNLIGFVHKSSFHFSSVELLAALQHKVPVRTVNGTEGILESVGGRLIVSHLSKDIPIELGSVIVTAGDPSGTIPGIPVGKVSRIISTPADVVAQVELEQAIEARSGMSVLVLQQEATQ